MKQILFFVTISLFTLTSCHKGSGVNPGSEEFFSNSSNTTTSTDANGQTTTIILPQSAINFIIAHYRGYTFKEVEQESEHGAIIYKVTIVSGNAKIRLLFDANWNFLGEKN